MSAMLPTESKSPSRRALLAGALGGLGAWAASAIGRAAPVRAEGEAIVVGGEYTTATSLTRIRNETTTDNVFEAESSSNGIGVLGRSNESVGVFGDSNSHIGVLGRSNSWWGTSGQSISGSGVQGWSSTGAGVYGSSNFKSAVQGYSGRGSLPAVKDKTGVFGYANQNDTAKGVWGHSPVGRGVQGSTTSGYAGYFSGKVFSTKFYELAEIASAPAPATNRARLFIRDNGSGKTQLCVRFHTGAIRVLATEA